MTIYLVKGYYNDGSYEFVYFYGAFSTKEKAEEIRKELMISILEDDYEEEIIIEPLELDEPTDVFYNTVMSAIQN